jgi:hypothetical protein
MDSFLRDSPTNGSVLSRETSRVLAGGFVEEQGCVLLAFEARSSAHTRVPDAQDETGYECFINHLHLRSLPEALEVARRLAEALAERLAGSFAVIVAFDGHEAIVRFHKLRAGQAWLSDDLEKYSEGIAVLDSSSPSTALRRAIGPREMRHLD